MSTANRVVGRLVSWQWSRNIDTLKQTALVTVKEFSTFRSKVTYTELGESPISQYAFVRVWVYKKGRREKLRENAAVSVRKIRGNRDKIKNCDRR